MLYLVLICLINLFISFVNARYAGLVWCESKAIGGWLRVLTWCAAIQSAIGFTSVYSVIAVYIAFSTGYFSAHDVRLFANLSYLLLVIPAIGSGLFILVSSWNNFFRDKCFSNFSVAAWNTFAEARNIYHAYHAFGPALKSVSSSFGGGGDSRRKNANVALLVVLVLILGILTTTIIIRRYAGSLDVPEEFVSQMPRGTLKPKAA